MKCPECEVSLITDARSGERRLCCPECCREWLASPSVSVPYQAVAVGRRVDARRRRPAAESQPVAAGERGEDLFNWF